MIGLIQRVASASVEIEQQCVAEIEVGIVALIAVQAHDDEQNVQRLLRRMISYRIFPDQSGKMNLSVQDIAGGVLLVPQFTLIADTSTGNRPSFGHNVSAQFGQKMFSKLLEFAHNEYAHVKQGQFGADMQVALQNDGPVTFWLEV